MTEKQFHDEIMRQGSMPIAWLRLAITKQPLTRDTSAAGSSTERFRSSATQSAPSSSFGESRRSFG